MGSGFARRRGRQGPPGTVRGRGEHPRAQRARLGLVSASRPAVVSAARAASAARAGAGRSGSANGSALGYPRRRRRRLGVRRSRGLCTRGNHGGPVPRSLHRRASTVKRKADRLTPKLRRIRPLIPLCHNAPPSSPSATLTKRSDVRRSGGSSSLPTFGSVASSPRKYTHCVPSRLPSAVQSWLTR